MMMLSLSSPVAKGFRRLVGNRALDEYTQAKHVHLDLTQTHDRHMFDLVVSAPLED